MNNSLKILLLAGNTRRARAYAQYLANLTESIEIHGLFYGFKVKKCDDVEINLETKNYFENEKLFIPDLNTSIEDTFKENNWHYESFDQVDVNSVEIISAISKISCDIVIFAGYGGQLLKKDHFNSEKKYLHMHPGNLPNERGSTTLYYSILNQKKFTVTAFYMTKEIDAGTDVQKSQYNIPEKNVDIDLWVDNVIRADCLTNALTEILNDSPILDTTNMQSEEYYVIHPVLKHVAKLSLKS